MSSDVIGTSSAACVLVAEEVWGSTLAAMRTLGRRGVPVYVATAGEGSAIYSRSRYCTAATDLSSTSPQPFCADLRAWIDAVTVDVDDVVIIPLSDRLVEYLHTGREQFGVRHHLSIPPPDVIEPLLDKSTSLEIAESAGLDVPAWTHVTSTDDIASVADLELPVVVRPTSWSKIGGTYFKVKVCSTRDSLDEVLGDALADGAELIVQEYIEAPDDAVEFAITWRSPDGSVSVACTGRKRRQASPDGGVMVWGETIDDPELVDLARSFMETSGFTGLGGIEFIRHGDRRAFIEFNPRLEAIHFLAIRAGVDTVSMEFDALAHGVVPDGAPRQLPATAWLGNAWLIWVMSNPSDLPVALLDRLRFGMGRRRIKAIVDSDDPWPSFAVVRRLVVRGSTAMARAAARRLGMSGPLGRSDPATAVLESNRTAPRDVRIGDVRIGTVSGLTAMGPLADEWDDLVERTGASIFQSRPWVEAWSTTLATDAPIRVITARDDEGRLVGLLALADMGRRLHSRFPIPLRYVGLAGSGVGAADHLGPIADHYDVAALLMDAAISLAGNRTLLLENVSGRWRTQLEALDRVRFVAETPCFSSVRQPGESFSDRWSPKMRKNIARRSRRLTEAGIGTRWVDDPDRIPDALRVVSDLHRKLWRSRGQAGLMSPERMEFLGELTRRGAHRSLAHVLLLERDDGTPIGALFALTDTTTFSVYKTGWDPAWHRFGVGLELGSRAMRRAEEQGLTHFDYLRSERSHKLDLGCGPTSDLTYIVPRGASGRLLLQRERFAHSDRSRGGHDHDH